MKNLLLVWEFIWVQRFNNTDFFAGPAQFLPSGSWSKSLAEWAQQQITQVRLYFKLASRQLLLSLETSSDWSLVTLLIYLSLYLVHMATYRIFYRIFKSLERTSRMSQVSTRTDIPCTMMVLRFYWSCDTWAHVDHLFIRAVVSVPFSGPFFMHFYPSFYAGSFLFVLKNSNNFREEVLLSRD